MAYGIGPLEPMPQYPLFQKNLYSRPLLLLAHGNLGLTNLKGLKILFFIKLNTKGLKIKFFIAKIWHFARMSSSH
jgi:hypothetical protein